MQRIQWCALLALALSVFSASSRGADNTTITFGWSPCVCLEPVLVAQEKGIFQQQGLNVQFERFRSFSPIAEALLAKKIDVGTMNSITALNAALGTGIYMKLIYPMNFVGQYEGQTYGPQAFVVTKVSSPISSVSDLKGKTVGIGAVHDVGHIALLEALRRHGIDQNQVKFAQLPFPQMEGAIANGEVDASLMIYPFVTFAQERGTIKIVAPNIDDVLPDTVISWLAVHPDFLAKNRTKVSTFVKSLIVAIDWMHKAENTEERYKILSKWTSIPIPVIRKMGLKTQYFRPLPHGFHEYSKYLKPWNELMMRAQATNRLVDFDSYDPKLSK